jgi:hypothetical protein
VQFDQLSYEEHDELTHLRDQLMEAQMAGDLFAEWTAANCIASYLWQLSIIYRIDDLPR